MELRLIQIKSQRFAETAHLFALLRLLPLLPGRRHGRRVGEPPHGRSSCRLEWEGFENIIVVQINQNYLSHASQKYKNLSKDSRDKSISPSMVPLTNTWQMVDH